jgi:hypothetical protein
LLAPVDTKTAIPDAGVAASVAPTREERDDTPRKPGGKLDQLPRPEEGGSHWPGPKRRGVLRIMFTVST